MADHADTAMGGASPVPDRVELAADASNIQVTSEPEERAAKRLKVDNPAAEASVPGEGLHDAPVTPAAPEKTTESSAPASNGESLTTAQLPAAEPKNGHVDGRSRGSAPIKKEYLLDVPAYATPPAVDDDAAEAGGSLEQSNSRDDRNGGGRKNKRDKKAKGGQNTEREYGNFDDAIRLCNSRAYAPEFSPRECRFGDRCRLCHDLRKYLDEGRRGDVETLGGKCHVFEVYGRCPSGWKCRFVKSHMKEVEHEDGRKELVLLDKASKDTASDGNGEAISQKGEKPEGDQGEEREDLRPGVYNIVSVGQKIALNRKRVDFPKAEEYIGWLNKESKTNESTNTRSKEERGSAQDNSAQYVEPPFLPSEKRRLYFAPETPTLAPLTTQGNLPFRRICIELGAQLTYSEMALGMPLLQGIKNDWTLLKAHETEISPPKFTPGKYTVFDGYDNARDLKFGAQISSNQHWVATKVADLLNRYCPHLRLIDMNCGCPIDMVYKSGGGSALLESQGKLERMIRGMNAMSGEIPITAKIRTGVKTNRPVATSLIGRLAFGSRETRDRVGAPGCAAVTLHGRSREMRYTKQADWSYIGECAALIKTYNDQKARLTDTAAEPDARTLANTKDGRMYFLGNGDCFSHLDYNDHIDNARVDAVMIGRGALIKPWLFEEIEKGQHLDKSSSERLTYIEKFVRYGLEAWGSDELGIGYTRRFLLEWLSFTHRYVPIGLLEYLPASMNDRPPAYKGRDELETLMASTDYRDWIKITEMFLGPVHPTFKFQPKHKSNAYEAEG